ncbi:MAG: tetratricopeptide repeat protein, partial [Gemmatimonadetes bacterium]|nr:tetratricopeptide repeat protein [Gemmatimonadota bacterium]NIR77632.1 tetratricopeptide repeat protein [Gemmatimonadota bacterium]NIT86173.1 tetratricopeptide repeat protein [Gemmatimonadota bacterium]NIU29997.1 tetratricopeptide repeat protein [Gemmatimonadota bacterium]NIU34963.1 tetratricopeptide repeat protein [Gemmatimonadota bacterium]
HLWAETYDRRLEVDNVFAVQTDVARRVARALEATLRPEEEDRISGRPTESLAAYDLYLQARDVYYRFEDEANEEAIRLFRSALDEDPDYALAWAGIANAFSQRAFRYGRPLAWRDSAVRYARRAIELGPELPEGHRALGLAYSIIPGRGEAALEAHLRALELDPNDLAAANNIGVHYLDLGRFDEAIPWFRQAARLAPNIFIPTSFSAYTYDALGLDRLAQKWRERALVLDPDLEWHRLRPAVLALYGEDRQEALSRAEEFVRGVPGNADALRGAAAIAYMARDFERAVGYARESLRVEPALRWNPWWHDAPILLGICLLKSAEGGEALREAIAEEERRIEEGSELFPPRLHLAAAHAAPG